MTSRARPVGPLGVALALVVIGCACLPADHLQTVTDADVETDADVDAADVQVEPPCLGFCGLPVPPSMPIPVLEDSACKVGFYQGPFVGTYDTPLAPGVPLVVAGNVQVALDEEGAADQACAIDVAGEGIETESCSDVFTLAGGSITGVLGTGAPGGEPKTDGEAATGGDAGVGGYPYFCTLTGTLDCAKKELQNGWIQCTYCDGPLADGGGACDVIGGRFAGPVTNATYDTSTGILQGAWNGAEALAGNDGGSPGPEGGPVSLYLALDGGYGDGQYGGSGSFGAVCLDCEIQDQ